MEEAPPGIRFEDLRYRAFRGAALIASGAAERASLRRDTSAVEATRLTCRLPGRPGEPDVRIVAARGAGNLRARELEVSGGVTARRAGDEARTERARWTGADGIVRGDRPVSVRGPGRSLDGPGFSFDPASGKVHIDGGGSLSVREARR